MNGKSDDDLVRAIQADDESSLRELLLRHYTALCRFAYGYARQHDLAEEAVLRVFEDLWRRRRELAIRTSAKAWLYGAVRLQTLDRLRLAARHRATPIEELATEPEDPVGSRHAILQEEMELEVQRVLGALPPQRQLVFRLNRIDGLRYREIAEILQVSEQTVQNHMVLAVRQLAPALPRLRELMHS